jgi:hypothetical protein
MTNPAISRDSSCLMSKFLWSRYRHRRIWVLLSVIRGLAISVLPWMLDMWSSCWTVLWKQGFQVVYIDLLSPVLQYCDFSKQSFSVYDDLFPSELIFIHCSSSLICLPIIHVCWHNLKSNVADLSQMLQLNVHQWSGLFQNQTSLPFSNSFTWIVTQHNH